jgi:hypothetical protein
MARCAAPARAARRVVDARRRLDRDSTARMASRLARTRVKNTPRRWRASSAARAATRGRGRRATPFAPLEISAASRGAARSARARGRRVVVVPGFLTGSDAYEGVARALARAIGDDARVRVAPVKREMWFGTLRGGSFEEILDVVDACAREAARDGGERVCLVGHSAGGWLGRLYLGDARAYRGEAPYDGARFVDALITLGAPHGSLEKYPFGRVRENRPGESESMPDDARGSSLAFTNYYYPGAYRADVRYVDVVGDYARGSANFELFDALCDRSDTKRPLVDRVRAAWEAFTIGVSYAANCGRADVRGDGVTPIDTAHALTGSEHVILPGVYHGPTKPTRWYGADSVVELWYPYCL